MFIAEKRVETRRRKETIYRLLIIVVHFEENLDFQSRVAKSVPVIPFLK